jgi:hypothetical protein
MTDKKTPEDLAEIFVFEHAHDQFGLSKQECYVAGYNAASQETSLLREENEKYTKVLKSFIETWNEMLDSDHPNPPSIEQAWNFVCCESVKALNPKQ